MSQEEYIDEFRVRVANLKATTESTSEMLLALCAELLVEILDEAMSVNDTVESIRVDVDSLERR